MKSKHLIRMATLLGLVSSTMMAAPLGTAFTYQGQLTDGGVPANGSYDLKFTLYDAASGGSAVSGPITNSAVGVTNGLFTTALDFGAGIFTGEARWLEIAVRTNGGGDFTVLGPRQVLTPTPHAFYAANAGLAVSAQSTAPGVISNLSLATGAVTTEKIADGTILPADLSPALRSGTFWRLDGNAGTTPGTHFVGTTDNQPLELRAGNSPALRLEPGAEFAPNVIAGSALNSVAAGVRGATIAGGGTINVGGVTNVIRVLGDIGLGVRGPGGGTKPGTGELGNYVYLEFTAEHPVRLVSAQWNFSNTVVFVSSYPGLGPVSNNGVSSWTFAPAPGSQVFSATFTGFDPGDSLMLPLNLDQGTTGSPLGSDYTNGTLRLTFSDGTVLTAAFRQFDTFNARATFATESVAAWANRVDADYGAVGGGRGNTVSTRSFGAVVGGGYFNNVSSNSQLGIIGGGINNQIGPGTAYAVIAGGHDHKIASGATYAAIGGGYGHTIAASAPETTIGGGSANSIGLGSQFATIGGGGLNQIGTNSLSGVVGGGYGNSIANNSWDGTIAGGSLNSIGTNSYYATVGGGRGNKIGHNSTFARIGGGGENQIGTNCVSGMVGGGFANSIADNSWDNTIAGGSYNSIGTNSNYAVIGGGRGNTVAHNATCAIIPGGQGNFATNHALSAGRRALARHTGALVWGDSTDADIASTNANSVTMRASGGYRLFSNAGATAGVYLAPGGGSWTSLCDRNAKEDFQPVNPLEVLAKVAALPVTTWKYKSQDGSVRHIGPTAQDFHAAFGVGESDTGITGIDADGVALAAIQGLNRKLEAHARELETENQALRERVARLEKLVQQLLKSNGDPQ